MLGKGLGPRVEANKYHLLGSKKHPKRGAGLEKCPDIQYQSLMQTPEAHKHRFIGRQKCNSNGRKAQEYLVVPANWKS